MLPLTICGMLTAKQKWQWTDVIKLFSSEVIRLTFCCSRIIALSVWSSTVLERRQPENKTRKSRSMTKRIAGLNYENRIGVIYIKHVFFVESGGFWRWFITLRITGFTDFIQRPEFQITRKRKLPKLDQYLFSGETRDTPTVLGPSNTGLIQWLRLALSKRPNRVCVYLPSPKVQ
jgi:hypothetical protein